MKKPGETRSSLGSVTRPQDPGPCPCRTVWEEERRAGPRQIRPCLMPSPAVLIAVAEAWGHDLLAATSPYKLRS